MSLRQVGSCVAVLGLWAVSAHAGPVDPPAAGDAAVPLGSWVRVVHWECGAFGIQPPLDDPAVCPAVQTEGRVIGADREHLSLRRGSQEFAVSLASERVLRLDRRRSRFSLPGAARGLKRGALVGLALGSLALLGCSGDDCAESGGDLAAMVATLVGTSAATGAGIGLVFGGGEWESVSWKRPPPPAAQLLGRDSRPRMALALSLSF